MKKITFTLSLLAIMFTSCKNKQKESDSKPLVEVEEQATEVEKPVKKETEKVVTAPVVEKKKKPTKPKKEVVAPVAKKETPVASKKKEVHAITLAQGTVITASSASVVDTKDLNLGDEVALIITKDIKTTEGVVITRGSSAKAVVKAIQKEKKMSGISKLDLVLKEVAIQGKSYPTNSAPLHFEGKNRTANTAVKTGVGAGIGAAVGALVSKNKGEGAAIGAAIGAVAGGATNAVSKKKSLVLDEHTQMEFSLSKVLKFQFNENY
ncbi:hypothetical protein K4L44_16280 [Halosquirtibacter laminarini]|uniref:Uncharacterized protein n=1 Tax=Halosquirtibacter laminarini TaxID=3374600 RepID=A0AC61NEQ1_9BACT|nr:hypothetical protein K4L44_16280 [Prolixibacteraceae bacterium]